MYYINNDAASYTLCSSPVALLELAEVHLVTGTSTNGKPNCFTIRCTVQYDVALQRPYGFTFNKRNNS